MVNLGPQKQNVNRTIGIINASFTESRISIHPQFTQLEEDISYEKQIENVEEKIEKARVYRKEKLYETDNKPPLKNGPMKILRHQLLVLEDELVELKRRLRKQKNITTD